MSSRDLIPRMKLPEAEHFTCWNCRYHTKHDWFKPEEHQCSLGAKCSDCGALQHEDFRPVEMVRAIYHTLGRVDRYFSDHMDWYADGTVTMQPYHLDPEKLAQLKKYCKMLGFDLFVRGEPQSGYAQHDPACIWIAIRKVNDR